MVMITMSDPAGERTVGPHPDPAAAVLWLASLLTPEEVGRLRLALHRVQLRHIPATARAVAEHTRPAGG